MHVANGVYSFDLNTSFGPKKLKRRTLTLNTKWLESYAFHWWVPFQNEVWHWILWEWQEMYFLAVELFPTNRKMLHVGQGIVSHVLPQQLMTNNYFMLKTRRNRTQNVLSCKDIFFWHQDGGYQAKMSEVDFTRVSCMQ